MPTDRLLEKQAAALQARGLRTIALVGETVGDVPDARLPMLEAAFACDACRANSVTYASEADLLRYD